MKSKYFIDVFDKNDVLNLGADLSEKNDYITETAGFIPLEVKLKQFEQNGIKAKFEDQDFTSKDYRELYLNPDFDLTPEDEIEDVLEKLEAFKNYQNEVIERVKARKAKSSGTNEKAGTDQPKTENIKVSENVSNKQD